MNALRERAGSWDALSEASGVTPAALQSYSLERRSPRSRNLWLLHLAREGDTPEERESRLATYASRVAAGLEVFTGDPRAPRRSLVGLVREIAGADLDELEPKAAALERVEAPAAARCDRAVAGGEDEIEDEDQEQEQEAPAAGLLAFLRCG